MPAASKNVHEGQRVRVIIGSGLHSEREGIIKSTRILLCPGSTTNRRKQCLCLIEDEDGETFEVPRIHLCLA